MVLAAILPPVSWKPLEMKKLGVNVRPGKGFHWAECPFCESKHLAIVSDELLYRTDPIEDYDETMRADQIIKCKCCGEQIGLIYFGHKGQYK